MDETRDSPPAQAPHGADRVVGGRYLLLRRLGRGATKDVYLAHDERLDREVAVAFAVGAQQDATARARLEREARVTGRLGDHPNIVTVYDTTEIDGVPCLVLRAMADGSLADALDRGPLDLPTAVRVAGDIARALAHAHAHGVVHRDVKPGNVWLDPDGVAALGDFGIAHVATDHRLTVEGALLGTPRYMSPEQIRGAEVGPASDLYSLGVVLYELVTQRPPFVTGDVLVQHLAATPAAPETAPELARLILELLEKDPLRRPESAASVAARLAVVDLGTRPDARRVVAVLVARFGLDEPGMSHGALIERHGGTVVSDAGAALVGLFPLGEAERAIRVALELRATVPSVSAGLEAGEIAGTGGAAITAAERLAQRAAAGEVLVGAALRAGLPAGASVDPDSGRLLGWVAATPLGSNKTPFLGRSDEVEALELAFAQAAAERVCRLVTVVGTAGIGKSRLAAEFATAVSERGTVLAGRCQAYGEGTTYQAFADLLGDEPRTAAERHLPPGDPAWRALLAALGLAIEPVEAGETAWALRRLLERVAYERPLLVILEDIHWAEPPVLDAIDHIVALSSGSPILIVCLARPELLETRPAWLTPQRNRLLLTLDGLADEDAADLAQQLGAGTSAARIAARADGNPLFVEQLVAMDAGEDELPLTVRAVLAARIDRLDDAERAMLQRASVEGRTFHAGALATREPGTALVGLVRKGLIAPDRSAYPGESAFRFTHALIRETAYLGVTKQTRAQAHAQVADWLEARAAADPVIAHQLERACRLRAELGRADPALAARAVERLSAAAGAASARGDPAEACRLIERAIALVGPAARVPLLPALGAARCEAGRMREAMEVLDEAIAQAPGPRLRARAQVEREFVRLQTETAAGTTFAERVACAALEVLDDDVMGQCRAWSLHAQVAWVEGQVERADGHWRRAQRRAGEAGDERQQFAILGWRATAAVLGPTPVDQAIERCEHFRALLGVSPVAVAWALNPLASLHAMRREFDLAQRHLREANETLAELGSVNASVNHHEALVMLLAGEWARAEAVLRPATDRVQALGDGGLLATTSAMLAQALYAQDRLEEAEACCEVAHREGAKDDIVTQVIWRGVQAKTMARRGEGVGGEALAREAVALAERTDLLLHRGDAMLDLGRVLRIGSREQEAEIAISSGFALHRRKGNVARLEGEG